MWNKFYKASFYRKTGIVSIEGVNQGEDYAVIPRILYNATKIGWLDKQLYSYNLINQSSYSNNISLASIESQKKADDILYKFFKEIKEYKDIIGDLYIRSMLFLIKTSKKEQYKDILNIYKGTYYDVEHNLSFSDKIILQLLDRKYYSICESIIYIAKRVFL